MQFKHIHQPEFALEFRAFHRPTLTLFPVYGFNASFVFEDTLDGVETSKTNPARREDCVIDQWTGLLDQEEKKIFSNDIVEVYNNAGESVGLFIVRFINLQGRYVLDGLTPNTHSSRLTLYQKIRIVGNAHENPELCRHEERHACPPAR